MDPKKKLYVALSLIVPVGVAVIVYGLAMGHEVLSLLSTGIVIVGVRGRLFFGTRVPHGRLFFLHLGSSIAFLLALLFLVLVRHSSELDLALLAFFALPLSTGAVLWARGMRNQYSS